VLPPDEITTVDGQAMVVLARAAVDEIARAPSLDEAVVVLDAVVSRVRSGPRTTPADIAEVVASHPRLRGLKKAGSALALTQDRVMSPPETRLRMRAIWLGLTRLRVNWPVFTLDGRLVGIVDLLDEDAAVAFEYDGVGHRDPDHHHEDNVREEALETLNLVVARFGGADARRRGSSERRILAAHAKGMRRDRSRDRWTATPPEWWWGSDLARRWALSRPTSSAA
jgi:hypothetical protein